MGPSRLQLENIVSRSGCTEMETISRFTVETVQSDEDGSLQKISLQPRRYFYLKSGARSGPATRALIKILLVVLVSFRAWLTYALLLRSPALSLLVTRGYTNCGPAILAGAC
jgi:hypothetical protein